MRILTFDIEEWFHTQFDQKFNNEENWSKYESRLQQNMDLIFQALDNKKQNATFFCLGWVARKFPDILKRIDNNGHEIACHSDMHHLAYLQNRSEFKDDFERAMNSIEDLIGKKVRAYRAPAFSIKKENKWAFEIIIENGIEIDCSIFPAQRDYGGFSEFKVDQPCWIDYEGHFLKEFPMNSFSLLGKNFIFSGGGFFRFLPYWSIKKMTTNSNYIMAYFHPRDFDPNQPMIDELSLNRKFKSYYGLKWSFKKLQQLLDDFDFIDLASAEKKVDWGSVPVVKIA